ncbi:MAG TPA: dihydroneopterin aldolase [Caulobacteraceae bacterium]
MTAALPFPAPAASSAPRLARLRVFVRELRIEAEIGIYAHEHGRKQPLVIDVELEIAAASCEHIADTLNYELVVTRAQQIADAGHLKLIETFAERLAQACLEDERVTQVRVRVEKPEALAPRAAAAGVEIVLDRS